MSIRADAPRPSGEKCSEKYNHPDLTAEGAPRARVPFAGLETLWVNTGTQCNIECANCYIESSPTNDRLAYISASELAPFLDEARSMGAREIGFTGGEPFMNPEIVAMAEAALMRGFSVLILTNAMKPLMRRRIKDNLSSLRQRYGSRLALRVSLDHYAPERHDEERGRGAFAAALDGFHWLSRQGFTLTIAGRLMWGEDEAEMRAGFAQLFADQGLALNANDPRHLILFPEMDETAPVPEITQQCWSILGKDPRDVMCASERMIVKRKGASAPVVLACTLIAYEPEFELGDTLGEAARDVKLNHPHCAKFCVLGGASCSG